MVPISWGVFIVVPENRISLIDDNFYLLFFCGIDAITATLKAKNPNNLIQHGKMNSKNICSKCIRERAS